MTLEELQESANRDLKIDDTDLGTESINIPILHNKYLQHFNKFSLLLKKAEYDHKVLKRQKWEYYTGKSDPSVYKEKPFGTELEAVHHKGIGHTQVGRVPTFQKSEGGSSRSGDWFLPFGYLTFQTTQ